MHGRFCKLILLRHYEDGLALRVLDVQAACTCAHRTRSVDYYADCSKDVVECIKHVVDRSNHVVECRKHVVESSTLEWSVVIMW